MRNSIVIKGAREHNLKNIDIEIPRDKLVVLTGISGSGKSSLAFDTIYAEGQRRYVESLSSYARQFLGQMDKPDVDQIDGLSPAISIDQKTTSKNPRSTVGTVTEVYDYLRLLWARVGTPHCPKCGKVIKQQTIDQIIDQISALPDETRIQVLAPVVRARKGEHKNIFEDARKNGYVRVRVDGSTYTLEEDIELQKTKKHTIEIVVDRLVIRDGVAKRLTDSVETAANLAGGLVVIDTMDGNELLFSQNYACDDCGISIEELAPRMFSFNTPYGACPTCTGLGFQLKIDPDKIIRNKNLSLREGAVAATGWSSAGEGTIAHMYFTALGQKYGFTLDTPVKKLSEEALDAILYGTKGEKISMRHENATFNGTYSSAFEGIVNNLERRYHQTTSDYARGEIEECMSEIDCPDCGGKRLKKESLAVKIGDLSIADYCDFTISKALAFLDGLSFNEKEAMIAAQILKEIRERLGFLQSVGLHYLTLSRSSGTLSGGESQRIRLATQIGSSLMGVLYILDEPSIGLHQKDNDKLLVTLARLRDLGNTLLVVEHDEDTIRKADFVVDIGPGAGVHGGEVVFAGPAADILTCEQSITGQYLSGRKSIPLPEKRRKGSGKNLVIKGARQNNLKNIDVKIPLGKLVAVTGVSGSGKSSLVNEILYKRLAAELNGARTTAGAHDDITGIEHLDKVIDIDQSPIGRTPRSNPATYTGLFTDIRDLFASTPDAKIRGYGPGRFSFNVRGGRCEACAGDGLIKIEMHFLPDIYVPCDVCHGKRYNRETLEARYKGKNISDVLEMTVEEALSFFENLPRIHRKIETLYDVGLGYIKLGQPSTTLSGGEAQRVKLATYLSRKSTGSTLYVLDEPTTGLHTADVHRLIGILDKLVEGGNTVVVIEHNLEVIKTADHIIDLGPDGGDGGGEVLCVGTPEQVAKHPASFTGQYLAPYLK
ncbi:excinuclease ABC subunit UvrA [Oscillospiraceae bacterium OttesenSCG-928-G22]|nr:excinuclease ABC subunit UvrA [Oscillospiraceae bacterium OttesenSCG-928-G22]